MTLTQILFVLFVASRVTLADRCGVTDFLEQLIQSVQSVQSNGQECGSNAEPKVGKAGPQGIAGPPGPPGVVDMAAVEQLIQRKIDENKDVAAVEQLIQRKVNEVMDILIEYTPAVKIGVCYIGMKSGLIPNSALTASTIYGPRGEAYQGRIDNTAGYGAWIAKTNVVGQWLQVDFGSVKEVSGVITQGRHNGGQWIKTYKVSCGVDEGSLMTVRENGSDKVFQGNRDWITKVYRRFPKVLSCRLIRIYPLSFQQHTSLRVEFVAGRCFNFSIPL